MTTAITKRLLTFFFGLLGPMMILWIGFRLDISVKEATELCFVIYVLGLAFCMLTFNYLQTGSFMNFRDKPVESPY